MQLLGLFVYLLNCLENDMTNALQPDTRVPESMERLFFMGQSVRKFVKLLRYIEVFQ